MYSDFVSDAASLAVVNRQKIFSFLKKQLHLFFRLRRSDTLHPASHSVHRSKDSAILFDFVYSFSIATLSVSVIVLEESSAPSIMILSASISVILYEAIPLPSHLKETFL